MSEKLFVSIGWSGNNYGAVSQSDDINGVVVATHKTLEGVKNKFKSALEFHIDGCIEDGDKLPEWVIKGDYTIEYKLEMSALIHSLDGMITRSAIARVSGINERQIGHYASGIKKPRSVQRQKIIRGIHTISRELASVA